MLISAIWPKIKIKGSLLSQTVKDGEKKLWYRKYLRLWARHRLGSILYGLLLHWGFQNILKLVRKWSLSGAIQILVIVLGFIRIDFLCSAPNLEHFLELLLFCACNGNYGRSKSIILTVLENDCVQSLSKTQNGHIFIKKSISKNLKALSFTNFQSPIKQREFGWDLLFQGSIKCLKGTHSKCENIPCLSM